MQKRQLGFTDMQFTTVGLGTWAIGGDNWNMTWGSQDDQESIAVIQKAIDLGVNWIDTAPIYGLGHAEEIVGQAIKGRRDQVYIATKFSLVWDNAVHKVYNRLKADSVRGEVEDSLRRLRIDVIDLLQVHVPAPDADLEEAWTTVAELVQEGKVRYGGVSNFNMNQLKRLHAIHPIASLQPEYNMLKRGIETEIMDYCGQQKIGIVAYSSLHAGLLTDRFDRTRLGQMVSSDWRLGDPEFQEPRLSANLDLLEKLRGIARTKGIPTSQLALAWVLRRAEITSAIVGARKLSQIEENISGSDTTLTTTEIHQIENLLQERNQKINSAVK